VKINAAAGEKPGGQHIELILGGVVFRTDAPVFNQAVIPEDAHHNIGVAHVNDEQHG
jgi:hypothetical protein